MEILAATTNVVKTLVRPCSFFAMEGIGIGTHPKEGWSGHLLLINWTTGTIKRPSVDNTRGAVALFLPQCFQCSPETV